MRLNHFFKTKKTLIIFIVPYTVMLVLIILVGSFTYLYSVKEVKQNLTRSTFDLLEKNCELMDTRFKEIDSIASQLAMDYRVQSFLNVRRPLSDDDYDCITEMVNKLPSYRITNELIHDILICFKNSDVLITATVASTRTDILYNTIARYKELDYEKWKETAFDISHPKKLWPAAEYTILNAKYSFITYIQNMPLAYTGISKGGIVVLLREEQIHNILKGITLGSSGWAYIADSDGQIITSIGSGKDHLSLKPLLTDMKGSLEISDSGEKMLIVYTTSPNNKWKYVAAIPSRVVLGEVEYIKKIYLFTVFIALGIGILCAVTFSYINIKPLKNLVSLAKRLTFENTSEYDEYGFLNRIIPELITSNSDLKISLEKNTPLLRKLFFEQLFKVGFNNRADLDNSLESIRLHIAGENFCTIIARIAAEDPVKAEEGVEAAMEQARDILKKSMNSDMYLHDLSENEFAILCCFSSGHCANMDDMEPVLYGVVREINDTPRLKIAFGIGRLYPCLTDMRFSFEEAMNALEYYNEQGQSMIWYDKISKKDSSYYYPVDLEMKLMNLVKSGEEDAVQSVLKSVYIKNFIQGKLSDEMLHELVNEIRGTLLKLLQQEGVLDADNAGRLQVMADRLNSCKTASSVYESAVNIFRQLCIQINSRKAACNNDIVNRMIRYIEAKYRNEDLCLYSAASHFNLSEKYLSQLFKSKTGVNFSDYIENIRMAHAMKLMKESRSPIGEIACKVGYTNPNTFYKAFKRVFGTNPKEYKAKTHAET